MKRRKGKSWVETDVEELLDLSPEDLVIVEFRAALAVALQRARKRKKLTQEEAAEMIGTSQAQVSKMEAGQASITLDRLIKALAALGVSRPAILRALNTAA
jgi:predicted XRE-type DNA-binding protein